MQLVAELGDFASSGIGANTVNALVRAALPDRPVG